MENSGGLCVRMTFTFTPSGLETPLYLSVSGLKEKDLCPTIILPDSILIVWVPELCCGGNDMFNTGEGWLMLLRSKKITCKQE